MTNGLHRLEKRMNQRKQPENNESEIQKEGNGSADVGSKTVRQTHTHITHTDMDEYGPLRPEICLVCILCFH